jgi:glutamine---fructose-6-phosphate transaminase (isomerizing)
MSVAHGRRDSAQVSRIGAPWPSAGTGADLDRLTAALGSPAQPEGIPVSVQAAADGDQLPSLLAQIPMTVRLRLLAGRFARLRRQNPDAAIAGVWDEPALWQMGAPGAAT